MLNWVKLPVKTVLQPNWKETGYWKFRWIQRKIKRLINGINTVIRGYEQC